MLVDKDGFVYHRKFRFFIGQLFMEDGVPLIFEDKYIYVSFY